MRDSKLLNIMKSLSPEELRDFEKYTASPYFSKGRDLLPLFKILKTFYPEFENDNLNAEFVFNKLYPGKKFDNSRSHNLIKTLSSQLFLSCKDFLIQQEFKNDEQRKKYYLLNQLRKKRMYQEYYRDSKANQNEMDILYKGSIREFLEKNFLETANRDYYLDRDDFENSFEANLKASEYSILAGIINTFKYQDELNVARGYNLKVRGNLMEFILDSTDLDKFNLSVKKSNHPLSVYIEIYYLIYKMNKNSGVSENYFKLKSLLLDKSNLFCQSENYILWNMMLSYCSIQKLPLEEHFFIHKHIIDNGIYKKSESEDFHIVLFRNIILVCTALNVTEWLENFINKYSGEIHTDHRNDIVNFSFATLNFQKENYGAALDYIQKIRFEFFLYKVDVRILQLKICYKLGYYEQVYSVTDSTLHFLKTNNEISDEFKSSVRTFIKYIKEFVKLKLQSDLYDKEAGLIRKNILGEKNIIQKNWLLSEAEHFGNR